MSIELKMERCGYFDCDISLDGEKISKPMHPQALNPFYWFKHELDIMGIGYKEDNEIFKRKVHLFRPEHLEYISGLSGLKVESQDIDLLRLIIEYTLEVRCFSGFRSDVESIEGLPLDDKIRNAILDSRRTVEGKYYGVMDGLPLDGGLKSAVAQSDIFAQQGLSHVVYPTSKGYGFGIKVLQKSNRRVS